MVPPVSDRVPPAPPYSGSGLGTARVSPMGLSPAAARLSRRLRLRVTSPVRPPYNPVRAATHTVWAGPLSLAATRGVTVVFLSSAYLDVSVRRVRLLVAEDAALVARRVAPFGHLRINGRSRLPAAFRSLPRPSSPPGAKASPMRPAVLLATERGSAAFEAASGSAPSRRAPRSARRRCSAIVSLRLLAYLLVLSSFHPFKEPFAHHSRRSVENEGFEPSAPSLQSWCSSQLS